jgi:hypothetical protein
MAPVHQEARGELTPSLTGSSPMPNTIGIVAVADLTEVVSRLSVSLHKLY